MTTASKRRASTCSRRSRPTSPTMSGWSRPRPTIAAPRIRSPWPSRCACASSASAATRSRARRPTASSWASAISLRDDAAEPGAVGRQSRAEPRRRRHLFGHRRGAIQGTLLGVPSMALSLALEADGQRRSGRAELGDADAPRRRARAPAARRRLAGRHRAQRQLSRLRARRGEGHRSRPSRASAIRACFASRTASIRAAMAYYWIGFERRSAKPPKDTDLWAVRSNLISVTPLCLDYTDESTRAELAKVSDGHGN